LLPASDLRSEENPLNTKQDFNFVDLLNKKPSDAPALFILHS